MTLPPLTEEGKIIGEVELKFSASGKPYATMQLVFNQRRKNDQTGEWEDGDAFWVRGTVFGDVAEQVAEWAPQTLVLVKGRLRTDKWEDQSGNKRSAPALMIDSIGPVVKSWQKVSVTKADREKPPAAGRQQPTADPWATGPSSTYDDSAPPF